MKIKSLINKYKLDNFSLNTLIFFTIINSGNLFSYIFQFSLARFTSIENFGLYNSVSSILMYFSAIVSTLPYFVTKTLSNKNGKNLIWNYFFLIFMIINLLIIIFHFFILDFIGFNDESYFFYIYSIINLSTLLSFLTGFLQYNKNYNKFSIVISLQMFFRFIVLLIFFLIFKNISVHQALLSNLIPIFFILIITIYFSYTFLPKFILSLSKINFSFIKNFFKGFLPIYLSNLLIIFILASDILLIKLKFDLNVVGIFSASAILAKIIFYLPAALSIISYSENIKNIEIAKIKIVILLLNSVSLALFLIYLFFGDIILAFSFGNDYSVSHSYLIINSLCYLLLANIVLLNYVLISREIKIQIFYISILFISAYLFCYFYIDNISSILKILLFTNMIALFIVIFRLYKVVNISRYS